MPNQVSSRRFVLFGFAAIIAASLAAGFQASGETGNGEAQPESKLTIVWTSGDPEVAHRMVLMYAHAAKTNGWFDEVRLIVWGPSSRLLAADKDVQAKIKAMQNDGVITQACIVCADSYGVTQTLRGLGLEVKGMGKPLSELVKDPSVKVLTF